MYQAHKWMLGCWILLFSSSCIALSSDSKEKLFITADTTIYNYKTGLNIYAGHVKVDQGTTHIVADRLTTRTNLQHKIREAIAYGEKEQAHYWTIPKLGDEPLHAKAKIIKFYPIDDNVILEKNVLVKQKENSFQGELIVYNMDEQTITVPATKTGRAVIVYNPDK